MDDKDNGLFLFNPFLYFFVYCLWKKYYLLSLETSGLLSSSLLATHSIVTWVYCRYYENNLCLFFGKKDEREEKYNQIDPWLRDVQAKWLWKKKKTNKVTVKIWSWSCSGQTMVPINVSCRHWLRSFRPNTQLYPVSNERRLFFHIGFIIPEDRCGSTD